MTKLKTSNTFMKRLITKIIIKRIRNEIEIPKIKRVNMFLFLYEREKEGGKMTIGDKLSINRLHVPRQEEENMVVLPSPWWKGRFCHLKTPPVPSKWHKHLSCIDV